MVTKEYILQEIKRTTEENGGKPIGVRKFKSETGITQRAWCGKYWARWSDALSEAGFPPNQPTSAYKITDILDQYARLALELGHLPSGNDIRLKARHTPKFPSDATFGNLCTKSALIRQVLEHCLKNEGFDDVIKMCKEYIPRQRKSSDESKQQEEKIGFVYLIKSGRFYKIGRSNDAGRREYELAIKLPEKTKKIHAIRTDDPVGIEAYWHKRFEAKRKNGEWFELSAVEVAAFKRRKFM